MEGKSVQFAWCRIYGRKNYGEALRLAIEERGEESEYRVASGGTSPLEVLRNAGESEVVGPSTAGARNAAGDAIGMAVGSGAGASSAASGGGGGSSSAASDGGGSWLGDDMYVIVGCGRVEYVAAVRGGGRI